ncbi:MAG: DNA alkylation repair protein [Chloroflexota bacterium]|nr:DNA alkylation repair protein [Chloroflexota bacterium]
MPAIKPARLKIQVVEIMELFDAPDKFLRALHDLLGFYADRTRRFGRVVKSAPLLDSYQVPKQVLRQIELSLSPKVLADSDAAVELADRLWDDGWLETRLLAISVLGQVSPLPPERVSDRVQMWGQACKEELVMKSLVSKGLEKLRLDARGYYFESVENWLLSPHQSLVLVGLRALPPLLDDDNFENLPLVFRWLAPLARDAGIEVRNDLIQVLRSLARRSPQETAYFLRKIKATASSPRSVAMIIRRSLDAFPADVQSVLRDVLRT